MFANNLVNNRKPEACSPCTRRKWFKEVFNLFGCIIVLTFWLVALAVKVLIVGGLLYFGIRILSPGTAARLREKFAGTRLTRY